MQNYGHGQPVYDRPGSTTSFTGQPPPPIPSYHQQQQWGQQAPQQQQQQAAPAYNPGTYGVMPGGYAQPLQQQYPPSTQPADPYAPQPHSDIPPPPPPKPYGFAAAVQKQNEQYPQQNPSWQQQQQQSSTGFAPQAQQGGYHVYNNAASIAPSTTPAGSYFPPSQGGRPGSVYGAGQAGAAHSPVNPRLQSTVMSPNEQAPAYIPPSLSGQGTQAYMPSNTNPMPGVYVPPPPDVSAWQQAQHAPLQGGNKRFTYTKPTVDPSFYAQGYQEPQQVQQHPPPLPPRYEQPQTHQPYGQQQPPQYPPQTQAQQQPQPAQDPYLQQQQQQGQQPPAHFGQLGQPVQPLQQQQYNQPPVPQTYMQQQAVQLEQYAQAHQQQQAQQQVHSPVQPQPQWQVPAPVQNFHAQQQHRDPSQSAYGYQQQQQQPEQATQAPKPLERTDTTPPNFVSHPSPQSQFVSPIVSQHASSFAPVHSTRTDSVSSIALANLHSQGAANRIASPKPPSFKNPLPPPPRDDASKFSALGTGGPSDWENFGAGEDIDDEELFARKPRPVQLDSVELPARQPSPPSTHGWPSPAQPFVQNRNDTHDTFHPTPPTGTVSPVRRSPSPKTPQQSFFTQDALVAPLRASPKPLQKYEAPQDARHGFVMGEVLWGEPDSPNRLSNATQRERLEGPGAASDRPQGVQIPAPVQVPPLQVPADDALAPSVETPKQKRPGTTRFFSDVGGTWGLSPKDKNRPSSPWGSKDDSDLPAKLQAKDEELWQLRRESKNDMQRVQAEIEAGKAEFLAEIERLKGEEQAARALARKNSIALDQQVEAMKAAAEQTKIEADALKKDNDLTIERIKEDIEGKEDTIRERDATIANLSKQLDNIRQELQEEKMKKVQVPEPPKPTVRDLIPDLDPWYAGSLERYITMLRGEANEPQVEDKMKTFKAFLNAESAVRGIDYYDEPPAPKVEQTGTAQVVPPAVAHSASGTAAEKRDLNVVVPQDSPDDDDYEYSPGGRPLLRRPTIPIEEHPSTPAPAVLSSQSTAILTPASSVHDDSTPTQSLPDEQIAPQYKAYVPPVMSSDIASSLAQRKATGPSVVPSITAPTSSRKNHDEIFFGTQQPRIGRADSDTGGVPVVAPLNLASGRPVSVSIPTKGNPLETLGSLLPAQVKSAAPSPVLEELRMEAASIKSASTNVEELIKSWEKSASLTRKKNADARRKRAEGNEAHNDDLFNSDEISYAELKDLEAEFKDKENKLKVQEDQDEVKSYVETVFDKVYNDLQADIAALTNLYIEAETLLQTSVSGVKSLGGGDAPTTETCLELLVELHEQIEKAHEQIVKAVAERDQRYKKTEIQPLYAAGNKAKLKSVEKHFEEAEKQAISRAKNEKAERMSDLHKVAEDAIVGAASTQQSERSRIIAAIRDLKDGDHKNVINRASETLSRLYESSKALLTIFNRLEIDLNTAEVEADIAQARVDGVPESKIQDLQSGMSARETELKEEFARRIGVLDQDRDEFEQLIAEQGGKVETRDEPGKETRLKAALEEAKRRNGHA